MNQTIPVSPEVIRQILSSLEELKKDVKEMKQKLQHNPEYGSDEWWQSSVKKGLADIQAGRVEEFDSTEEYIKSVEKLT